MNQEIVAYKDKFNATLEPFKVMLINKKVTLPYPDWSALVQRTEASIIQNPDQYLGTELPGKESLSLIVRTIFEDFLNNLN